MKLAARGAVVVVAGTLLALPLSAGGLESLPLRARARSSRSEFWRLSSSSRSWVGRSCGRFARQVSDAQVAMYSRGTRTRRSKPRLSARSKPARRRTRRIRRGSSEKLVEQAIEQCRAIERGTAIDRAAMKRHVLTLGGIAAATALIIALGPSYLRQGLSAIPIWRTADSVESLSSIQVKPGSAKVPKGADQSITAHLSVSAHLTRSS